MTDDLIEALLGIAADTPLGRLRAERAAIRGNIEGAYRALVLPAEPLGVSLPERAALAAQSARLEGDPALAAHYAGLAEGPVGAGLLAYGRRVTEAPREATQADIAALAAAGRSPQDIVAITQLVSFVPFQVRLLAGLRAWLGQDAPRPGDQVPPRAAAGFTMDEVGWTPRVPPVEEAHATPAQQAALDACPPGVRNSVYFRTLALDPHSLQERGALFNSVMYAPRGLPRAERELATAVVSLVNGCVYCCSVHARRYAELARESRLIEALMRDGFAHIDDPRARAVTVFSARLTGTPGAIAPADIRSLRAAGLPDLEILDLVHAIAMFANANRLMLALGDAVLDGAAPRPG